MKHWKIILAICLVALFCGCAGILFGFIVGEKIGELRHQETGSVGQHTHQPGDFMIDGKPLSRDLIQIRLRGLEINPGEPALFFYTIHIPQVFETTGSHWIKKIPCRWTRISGGTNEHQ